MTDAPTTFNSSDRCDQCGGILLPGAIYGHIMAKDEWFCSKECIDSWLSSHLPPARDDPRHPEYLANQHRLTEWHKEKRLNLRIYNNPNHPHYGPVRRLHIITLHLGFDDEFMDVQVRDHYDSWDSYYASCVETYPDESIASRIFLRRMFG